MNDATEVVHLADTAEIRDGTAIVRLSRTEAGLAMLKADLAGKTYDLATTKGDKDARADRLRCVTLRTELEKRRKALKAPALEFGKLIDSEAARITAAVLEVERPIDEAIKADEARREAERAEKARIEAEKAKAEAERVAKLQGAVQRISGFVEAAQAPGMTAERIAIGIARLEAMSFPAEAWQEFAAQAEAAKATTLNSLRTLHQGAVERETEAVRLAAERAELERQRAEVEAARAAAEAKAREVQAAAEALAVMPPQVAILPLAPETGSPPPSVPSSAAGSDRAGEAGGAAAAPDVKAGTVDNWSAPQEAPTLNLGAICTRLGFTLRAEFVAETLGIHWSATNNAAKLWRESDWPRIKAALVAHITALDSRHADGPVVVGECGA